MDYDSRQIFIDIEAVLSRLRIKYNSGTRRIKISPDGLFKLFIPYILLLPQNTRAHSFHLVHLYFSNLPKYLKIIN